MGPREAPPPFPPFEISTLPAEHVYPPLMMLEECNWVQALEGDIDSSHIDWVHGKLRADSTQRGTCHRDKRPRLEVLPTDYGACYSARRRWDVEGHYWHRITQFIMPFFTMIAASDPHIVSARAWVPMDDHYNLQFVMRGRLDRPVTEEERRQVVDPFAAGAATSTATSDPRTRYYTKANMHNDYLARPRAEATELMLGIPFLGNLQDRAMTETMGPIYDRTQEHLGTTDAMVIFMRRRLIDAARALREQGVVPANVDDPPSTACARPRSCCPTARAGSRPPRRRGSRTPACRSPGCRSSDAVVGRLDDIRRASPPAPGRPAGGRRPRCFGGGRGTGPGAAPSLAGRAPAGRHRGDP